MIQTEDVETGIEESESIYEYRLNCKNVYLLLTQSVPTLLGLFLVTYSFKFAKYADINQGCITGIFAITSIYIATLFYFAFGEIISMSKIVGLVFMCGCILCLVLESSKDSP